MTSDRTIYTLRNIFASYGLHEQLVTDACETWQFVYITLNPAVSQHIVLRSRVNACDRA